MVANLSRPTDELKLTLSTDHSLSSYGIPIALIDDEPVDANMEIGPGVTILDAIDARLHDLAGFDGGVYRLDEAARKMAADYMVANHQLAK